MVFRDALRERDAASSPGCWASGRTPTRSVRRSSSATCRSRLELIEERHGDSPPRKRGRAAQPSRPRRAGASPRAPRRSDDDEDSKPAVAIRSERFARLVTLACILIAAGRDGERVSMARVCAELKISEEELREDMNVLNVVNFGGGSYVLYAEIDDASGEIEVDPEPYSDNFDRPARLLAGRGARRSSRRST